MIEQVLSYNTVLSFSVGTTISHAFLPAMKKSLHTVLVNICTAIQNVACFHAAVTAAETHHPLPQCVHIHCLVSISVQQALMDVYGCNFFRMEEFSLTPFLQTQTHVRHRAARLLLCCNLYTTTTWNGILVGRFNLHCRTTNQEKPTFTSPTNMENKLEYSAIYLSLKVL